MSLDAPRICEICGENVHTYGHKATCLTRHYGRLPQVPSEAAIAAAFESFFRRKYEPQDGDDDLHIGNALRAAYAVDAVGSDAGVAARIDALTDEQVKQLVSVKAVNVVRATLARLLREEEQ